MTNKQQKTKRNIRALLLLTGVMNFLTAGAGLFPLWLVCRSGSKNSTLNSLIQSFGEVMLSIGAFNLGVLVLLMFQLRSLSRNPEIAALLK
jgi:hypothetical protein